MPSAEGRREAGISHRFSLLLEATEKCHRGQHPPKERWVGCQGEVGSPIPTPMDVIFNSLKSSPTELREWIISGNICQVHVENSASSSSIAVSLWQPFYKALPQSSAMIDWNKGGQLSQIELIKVQKLEIEPKKKRH